MQGRLRGWVGSGFKGLGLTRAQRGRGEGASGCAVELGGWRRQHLQMGVWVARGRPFAAVAQRPLLELGQCGARGRMAPAAT